MRQASHILRCGVTPRQRIDAINPMRFMAVNPARFTGFTLVELIVTMLLSLILLLAVGVVAVGGQRAWQWTYETANKEIKRDADAVMLAFGSMGRKSNRLAFDYTRAPVAESPVYSVTGNTFTPVYPACSGEEVVFGDAVEFRYWDVELDSDDTHDLMDVAKKATAYALFYLEDNKLKVDYGPCTCTISGCVGAVPLGGGTKYDPTTTRILAENVTTDDTRGAFSQTTQSGSVPNRDRWGSIRINITITDPEDGEQIKVMTTTLMRNLWPR
jgi:type II secretory pathway pseudopilin PulG